MSTTRPENLPTSMTPKVTWRRVSPADVLSALGSLAPLEGGSGRLIEYRGQSPEALVDWTFTELDSAEKATSKSDQERHASHVVGHAKKALDSLFDAYLERDFLRVHLRPRGGFKEKLDLLKERLGARVPWRLVPAIVAAPRDDSEHARQAPSVAEAGVAAEAAKSVIDAMVSASNPLQGPALAGSFLHGSSAGPWGHHTYVQSFPPRFAWAWKCTDGIPRMGVGVRTDNTADDAEVVYCELRDFTVEQHLEALKVWDDFKIIWWRSEEPAIREFMQLAGLDQPR